MRLIERTQHDGIKATQKKLHKNSFRIHFQDGTKELIQLQNPVNENKNYDIFFSKDVYKIGDFLNETGVICNECDIIR